MGCNAWNHPANCHCGWGGVFYGAGYRDGDDSWHWQRSDSYTIPNARCPRCLAHVFFYRSPYGGSVYFDDLGPPWPKHPCMDTGVATTRSPGRKARARPGGANPTAPSPPRPSWRPLICEEVRRHQNCPAVTILKVHSGSGGPKRLYSITNRSRLDHRTPFLVRVLAADTYEVSTLDALAVTPGEVTFTAYASPDGLPQPYRDQVNGVLSSAAPQDSPGAPAPAPSTPAAAAPPAPKPAVPAPKLPPSQSPAAPNPRPTTSPPTLPPKTSQSGLPAPATYRVPKGTVTTLAASPRPTAKRPPRPATPPRPAPPMKKAAAAKALKKRRKALKRSEESATKAAQAVASPAPPAPPAPPPPPAKPAKPVADSPLTNMQLAFQRLAASDPSVQDALVSGFRKPPRK